jgi:ligand-binding sensor domain-containing protein/signal transduction histidine kinase
VWSAAPPAPDYSVRRLSGDDGLPQDAVTSLAQTGDGYLWVGTGFGLARFDGARFTVFDRFNTPALHSDAVTALTEDSRGRLWIGTTRGLVRYRHGAFRDWTQLPFLPQERVAALLPAPDGTLWVGWSHGLTRVHDDHADNYGESAGIQSLDVRELHRLDDGRLLLRTAVGWQEFDPQLGRFLGARDRYIPATGAMAAWPVDAEGLAWVAEPEGISVNRAGKWRRVLNFPGDRPAENVEFYSHPALGLLAQVTPHGVYRWNGSGFQAVTANFPAWLQRPRAALRDQEGTLWVATVDGLMQLQRRSVQVIGQREGLPSDHVMTVSESPEGGLFVGTARGVSWLRAGRVSGTIPPAPGGRSSESVVLAARDGRLWYSTGNGEISVRTLPVRDGKVTVLKLGERQVRCLYEDRSGAVWIGTSAGVFRSRGESLESFPGEATLSVYDVRTLLQDRAGIFWIGTHGSGLLRVEGSKVTPIDSGGGTPEREIRSLCECRQGNLWVGTTAGLHLLQGSRWRRFTRDDGLAENLVNQILEDNEGRLWLTGVRGIHGIPLNDLDAVMAGRLERVRCLTLNHLDGMIGSETGGGLQPAGCRDQLGKLWFPTPGGLIQISPLLVRANTRVPTVLIEQVKVNHVALDSTRLDGLVRATTPELLTLPRGPGRTLAFRFTATTFLQNELVHFRYRLKGHDRDWRKADGVREATYTNLRPGDYEFEVMAANAHGHWSIAPASLRFAILPQFWETRVFVLAGVGVLVGVGYQVGRMLNRRRVARLKRSHRALEEERARIAKDLNDEIGASLNGLAWQADLASRGLEGDARSELETYAQRSRSLVERLREVVWAVNPECDLLDNFASYLGYYLDGLNVPEVRFRLDLPTDLPAVQLRSEVRHHLLNVFKEAIARATGPAGAKVVQISLRFDAGTVCLRVNDDGPVAVGAAEEAATRLASLRARVAAIGGRVDIIARPGEGTEVLCEVPADASDTSVLRKASSPP